MGKKIFTWVFFAFLVIYPTSIVQGAPYDTALSGKGDSATDVAAVQQAVDRGGRVLLKGTFEFGQDGNVVISKDVEIIGELNSKGEPTTIIRGGRWTFHSHPPIQMPPTVPGPKIGISNIHFVGARWAPVNLSYCAGADIRNNTITQVKPFDNNMLYFGKEGIHRQQGIIFYPPYTLPKEIGPYQPGLITGDIVVANNDIDLHNDIPDQTVAQGILIVGATGANIQVLRNRIMNVSRNSVECIDNYPGPDGEGEVLIKDNQILTLEKGIALPSPSTPNGIVAGWFIDLSGASDPARRIRIIVTGNKIETKGETSIGIIAIADDVVLTSNKIYLNGGIKARGILHFNSNALIANNLFEGGGNAGIMLTPWKSFKGNQNTLIDNVFSQFKAEKGDVVINGFNNIVIGDSQIVSDNGEKNLIVK